MTAPRLVLAYSGGLGTSVAIRWRNEHKGYEVVACAIRANALSMGNHGCTGKGNDQVRSEVSAMAIAPDLTVEAPIREWGLSREAAIAWAEERDIPIPVEKGSSYSIDENLRGRTRRVRHPRGPRGVAARGADAHLRAGPARRGGRQQARAGRADRRGGPAPARTAWVEAENKSHGQKAMLSWLIER